MPRNNCFELESHDSIFNSDLFRESRLWKIDLRTEVLQSTSYQYALQIIVSLQEAGFVALFAGGCVRDFLRNTTPNDYDIATNATPKQVREVFGKKHTQFVGASFGVVCVHKRIGQQRHTVEVATFRTDGTYSDGRRPDSIEFSNPADDCQRRDFTINGLYCDPVNRTVVDFVDGIEDLNRGVIRCIGIAQKRIEEDRLRMLRAVRFATRFDYAIDLDTCSAIREMAAQITDVSPERIAIELRKMLTHQNRKSAFSLLNELDLLPNLWPEYESDFSDAVAFGRAAVRLGHIELDSAGETSIAFGTVIAITLFQSVHWRRSQSEGSVTSQSVAARFQQAWKLSNDETKCIANSIAIANTILQSARLPNSIVQPALTARFADSAMMVARTIARMVNDARIDRVMISCPIDFLNRQMSMADSKVFSTDFASEPEDLAEVFGASWIDCMNDSISRCESLMQAADFDPAPLVDGRQLAKAGIKPGPKFSELLTEIRRRQLDGVLNNAQEAIDFATEYCSHD